MKSSDGTIPNDDSRMANHSLGDPAVPTTAQFIPSIQSHLSILGTNDGIM